MTDHSDDPIARGVKFLAEAAENRMDSHPSPKELVDYHHGRLAESQHDDLQAHLTLCRDCSALYLDLVEMSEVTDEAPSHSTNSQEWLGTFHAVRERLGKTPTPAQAASWMQVVFQTPRLAYIATAASIVIIGFLGVRIADLEETIQDQAKPQVNVAIYDVVPSSFMRSDFEAERTIISADTAQAILILNPSQPLTASEYQCKIFDDQDQLLWSSDILHPTDFGNFTLEISRPFLKQGQYRIELYKTREESDTLIDRFGFWIE